jgi:large subunit ribosomal protein L15
MELDKLAKLKSKNKKKKRVGRGYGSGKGGHTTGLGTKGQKARGSGKIPTGFEGGQVPLYKRIPQIGGFSNPTAKDIVAINIRDLASLEGLKDGSELTPRDLVEKGLIKRLPKGGVKILSAGDLDVKLILKGFLFSKAAKKKLEKSGSKIVD